MFETRAWLPARGRLTVRVSLWLGLSGSFGPGVFALPLTPFCRGVAAVSVATGRLEVASAFEASLSVHPRGVIICRAGPAKVEGHIRSRFGSARSRSGLGGERRMGYHHDEAEKEQVPFRLEGASGAGVAGRYDGIGR